MKKNPIQRDQYNWSDLIFQRNLTPVRAFVGVIALVLLLISALSVLILTTRSYAATTAASDGCTTVTATAPANGSPANTGTTATATPRRHKTPTPTPTENDPQPTDTPTSQPSPSPTVPTATPTTKPSPSPTVPTSTPTSAPTSTSTTTSQTGTFHSASLADSLRLLQMQQILAHTNSANTADQCTSPTAASATQTPDANSTTTTSDSTPGVATATTIIPHAQTTHSASGGSPMVIIVGGVFLVLLVGLAAGWFFFRKMLLPTTLNATLPPSGARPWSRIRVPNPASAIGFANAQTEQYNGPDAFGINQMDLHQSSGKLGAIGTNLAGPLNPSGQSTRAIAGPVAYSDGFIPPSPQIFPQQENSMIPPGSGAFPIVNQVNGFAPVNPAFHGMYGLDDPFASSQAGAGSWLNNLGDRQSLHTMAPREAANSSFVPTQADLNDPELAEIIRKYSQKSQAVNPQQMSPSSQVEPSQDQPGLSNEAFW